MARIYTKTGDKGKTGLVDGSRVSKGELRLEVLGALDEANAALGLLAVSCEGVEEVCELLMSAQSVLFSCGSRIADPAQKTSLSLTLPSDVFIGHYEDSIDALSRQLAPLNRFILPGGHEASARAHMARTVVRRAERNMIRFIEGGGYAEPEIQKFLNRLSDWLFVVARYCNFIHGKSDVLWEG